MRKLLFSFALSLLGSISIAAAALTIPHPSTIYVRDLGGEGGGSAVVLTKTVEDEKCRLTFVSAAHVSGPSMGFWGDKIEWIAANVSTDVAVGTVTTRKEACDGVEPAKLGKLPPVGKKIEVNCLALGMVPIYAKGTYTGNIRGSWVQVGMVPVGAGCSGSGVWYRGKLVGLVVAIPKDDSWAGPFMFFTEVDNIVDLLAFALGA